MRCRKCNHVYTPQMGQTACPRCRYDPYQDPDHPTRKTKPRRVSTRTHDRWAIGIAIACVVLAFLGMVTGQILISGGVTALLMGGVMLWSAFFMKSGGLDHPLLARLVTGIVGGTVFLGGIGVWVWIFMGASLPPFPPRYTWESLQAAGPYIVAMIILLLFSQGARLVDRWVTHREQRLQQHYRELGVVYPIPPFVPRQLSWFVILISTPVFLLLFLSSVNAKATGVSPQGIIAFPVIYLILMLPMTYFAHRSSGFVVLTDRGVILRRLWGQRNMLYEDIVRIRENVFSLPPNLVIKGKTGTLRIPRTVRNLPDLYRRLLAVKPKQIAEDVAKDQDAEPALTLPHTLTVGTWVWLLNGVSVLGLLAIWWAIALLPYWAPVTSGQPLRSLVEFFSDSEALLVVVAMGVLTGALFIPAILVGIAVTVSVREPCTLVLAEDEIRWRRPFAPWLSRPAGQIARIELEPVRRRTRVRHEGVVVTGQYTSYKLHIHFQDGGQITIGQTRAQQWHITPERLREMLRSVYQR